MSMQDTPCSGFILKAGELTKLLPSDIQPIYEKAIENEDCEEVKELLNIHLPSNMPQPEDTFTANAEMLSEEFEEGDVIVSFADSDLFTCIKTPALENMEKSGVTPIFSRWTVWG